MWEMGAGVVRMECAEDMDAMSRPQVGRAWCSPHDSPPLDCIQLHRNPPETAQSFFQEITLPEGCSHTPRFNVYDVLVDGLVVGSVRYCDACDPSRTDTSI